MLLAGSLWHKTASNTRPPIRGYRTPVHKNISPPIRAKHCRSSTNENAGYLSLTGNLSAPQRFQSKAKTHESCKTHAWVFYFDNNFSLKISGLLLPEDLCSCLFSRRFSTSLAEPMLGSFTLTKIFS